ncbi:MAG: DUF4132 domain-containing protein [Hyphomicrobiaceae bacterium]
MTKKTRDSALPEGFAEAMTADFGRLDTVTEGLGKRAIEFVLQGHPEAVLLEIANNPQARDVMLVHDYRGHNPVVEAAAKARGVIALAFETLPFEVVKRAGQVYALVTYQSGTYLGVPLWLIAVLRETQTAAGGGVFHSGLPAMRRIWNLPRIEACLTATGEPPVALLHLLYPAKGYYGNQFSPDPADVKQYLASHAPLVLASFDGLDAHSRTKLIEDLAKHELASGLYQDLVFAAALGSAKGPAQAAQIALRTVPQESLFAHVKKAFTAKDGATRRAAAEVAARLAGPDALSLLKAQLEAETAKPVRDTITALMTQVNAAPAAAQAGDPHADLPEGSFAIRAIDGSTIVIPPKSAPWPTPAVSEKVLEPLHVAATAYNAAAAKFDAEREAALQPEYRQYFRPTSMIDSADIHRVLPQINGTSQAGVPLRALFQAAKANQMGFDGSDVRGFFEQPEITIGHIARLADFNHWQSLLATLASPPTLPWVYLAKEMAKPGTDCRVLIETLVPEDAKSGEIVRRLMHRYSSGELDDIPLSFQYHILEHLDLFDQAFGVRPPTGLPIDELAAMRVLAKLDKIPEHLLHPLLNIALSTKKVARAEAQRLLSTAKTIDDAIIARLEDTKKEIRAAAADWLAVRKPPAAIAALRKALKKEKSELGRAAMLSALSKLGEDIAPYFDEKTLLKEAEAGLAKVSKSLDWFPFAALPTLQWANGKPVPAGVVKWWLVLADKLKDPAGNALFELYLDRCKPAGAAQFGMFILKAWIDRDTTSCSDTEANDYAAQQVAQHRQWYTNFKAQGSTYQIPEPNDDQLFKSHKIAKLNQHLFSASDNKGLLAFTIRAPGPEAAAMVRAYVKDHGNKVAQAKSLLTALARNPAPSAIQVVLSVANRIKQKTVQALAGELVADVADRRGWTPAELADRTIPSAGLDEVGVLTLDCGEDRSFRAVYQGEGKLDLQNPQGKSVKALPAPRGDADKDLVAAAKKALAGAKKEIKQTETAQRERFYEAMCVSRLWPLELWTSCLLSHPIAGRMVQRLVWQGLDPEDRVVATFRVLDDGSATDSDDNAVPLDGFAAVRLAHRALMSANDAKTWLAHLKDYEIDALFPQFVRPIYALDDAHKAAVAIEERKGWMIESLKLKSAATKLGYQTGEVGDGGSYMDYVKRFSTGLTINVGFTGSYMGAGTEKIEAALTELTFTKGRGKQIKLADVPPVLMSEAIGDLHALAAAGTGFDKDWQKKAHFG